MESDMDEEPENWKTFHTTTREYVIFLLLFIFLYLISYCFIGLFRKKGSYYQDCYEDAFANRISLWLSSFSLSVSIGAALLLPISVISNEVLLLYPNSYYVQWLNTSLIQGLWNHVFLFSNVSLFLFLPFSHIIMESEGFPGSRKGIMSRVNEALLVLGLIGLVIMGIIFITSAIIHGGPYIQYAFNLSNYSLPFLYSCVSFVGVLMLLLCTPFGFARLFSVMADVLKVKRRLSEPDVDSYIKQVNPNFLVDKNKENDHDSRNFLNYSSLVHRIPQQTEEHMVVHRITQQSEEDMEDCFSTSELAEYISGDEEDRGLWSTFTWKLKRFFSSLHSNCVYPLVMLYLVLLTILSVFMVTQNTLELCFGIKSLPVYSQNISLGISSLSTLGPVGASLEIIMILYLWCTSIVGLYSLPLFCRLKPKLSRTSLTQVIGNCAILLVLSSALPVLARILGITNFDLLGNFGRINWLGNFYVVLFYNILFAVSVAMCIGKAITGSVGDEIYKWFLTFCHAWIPNPLMQPKNP